MRPLLLAQLVGGLRLDRVAAAVELLTRGQGGQRAATRRSGDASQASDRARRLGRSAGRPSPSRSSWSAQRAAWRRSAAARLAIDAREALFALRGRHRVVEGGAVDLVAVIPPQTLDALAGHGTSRARVVRSAANSEPSATWPALRGSTITGQAASRTTRPATPPTSTE